MSMLNPGVFTLLSGSVPDVPLTLVHSALSKTNQIGSTTFSNLSFGAKGSSKRFVYVLVTVETIRSGIFSTPRFTVDSITWGASLNYIRGQGGIYNTLDVYCQIWAGFVPSSFGDSANLYMALHDPTEEPLNLKSLGVSTLVTNLMDDGVYHDRGTFDRVGGGSSATHNDVASVANGQIVAVGASSYHSYGFTSLAGNGANGSIPKVVDQNIANDHRHAVFMLDQTQNQTNEDFTMRYSRNDASIWTGAMASFR